MAELQLTEAFEEENFQKVQEIIIQNLYLINKKINGKTPLIYAIECKSLKTVEFLIKNGANPNIRCFNEGKTSFHLSCQTNQISILSFLLLHCSDVNIKDFYGNTPLHYANSKEIVYFLLKKGAEIDPENESKMTPLQVSFYYNNLEVCETLLICGANLDCSNENGFSLLHIAIEQNSLKNANFLIIRKKVIMHLLLIGFS